jgi:glycosyl transferase family 87
VLSALGLPAEPHYSVPVAPAFVVLGLGALLAPRREQSAAAWRSVIARRETRLVAGIAVGAVAAAWAVKTYVTKIHNYWHAGQAPHDLEVFLGAATKVIHAASPYTYVADQTYAYPPLLAFLVSPLEPLSAGWATLLWTLVSLAAVAAALWLLGVRDWRCFALAAAFPFTRSAVGLGTVGPLLLLAVALAWHRRNRLLEPGAAVGAAVALKLFVWPVALWLAFTRRIRPAAAAAGFALAFVLIPWAAIGFAGLGDYSHLLRRLADDEASSSYSVVALAVRAHLPEGVGYALALVATAALLAGAFRVARDARRSQRDRDVAVLTLALAAALAVSPIVWIHYFLLLLVPLALTRPRLTLLWFLPFAYYPLGESAWPAGDARKLALALAATIVLLLAGIWRDPGRVALAVKSRATGLRRGGRRFGAAEVTKAP